MSRESIEGLPTTRGGVYCKTGSFVAGSFCYLVTTCFVMKHSRLPVKTN